MTSPEMPPIRNHVELSYRIMKLNALKAEQEEVLKADIKELYYSFQPAELLRNMWGNVKENSQTKTNIGKIGLGLGADFIIRKIFGKSNTVKGFISSVIFEKVASHFLNRHADVIAGGVSKLSKLFRQSA